MLFSVSKGIHSLSENSSIPPDGHILEILSLEEALGRCRELPGGPALKRILGETAQYCKAETLPDCILGTLVIPDRQNALKSSFSAVFCLTGRMLLLAVADGQQASLLDRLSGRNCWTVRTFFSSFSAF